MFLDCRTNTWRKLPSMQVARSLPPSGVIDGKIYVFGGCKNNDDSSSYGEVFDPKTQTWHTLGTMPDRNIRLERINSNFVTEEKVYAVENTWVESQLVQIQSLYYSPSEGKWGIRNIDSSKPYLKPPYVMIGKLLYCCDNIDWWTYKLFWCEKEEFKWKEVKGLDLGELFGYYPDRFQKLSNFGENIVVFWCEDEQFHARSLKIWCAEISLERREEEDEIWGKVEWSDALMITLDNPIRDSGNMVLHSVSVNL